MSAIHRLVAGLRRELRERWSWYREQQRVPLERRWWDAYNT